MKNEKHIEQHKNKKQKTMINHKIVHENNNNQMNDKQLNDKGLFEI